MKLPAWVWAAAAGVGSVVVVAACVGDDPPGSSGIQPNPNTPLGEQGGRCNAGRCLDGLYCEQLNNVCLIDRDAAAGNGGTSSSGNTTSGSSGTTSSSSGAIPKNVCPFDAGPRNQLPCPNTDAGVCSEDGGICCVGTTGNTCGSAGMNCASRRPVACVGRDTCPGTEVCCLVTDTALIASDCNVLTVAELIQTSCSETCAAGDHYVCHNDAECPPAKPQCRKLTITASGNVEIGVCF